MTSSKYYTYAYLREDRTPYYVGKGMGNRIYVKHQKGIIIPKDKSRIIFLKQNLTEEEAFKHEIYMIAVFGRKDLGNGILRNLTSGGEGSSGRIKSEEERKMISERMRGKNNPNYGKICTEEERRNLSENMRGKNNPFYGKSHTEEYKKNRSGVGNPMYGKKRPEHSERMRQRLKGKNNPLAKTYILIDPEGVEYIVNGELMVFCNEKGIEYGCMKSALRRKQTTPRPSNGWSIRQLTFDVDFRTGGG
jgi:hypothetical protein